MNTSDSAPAETIAAQENATDLRQAAAFTAEEVHERTWDAIEWVLANPAYAWVSLIYVVAVFDGGCVVAAGVMCAAIFWGWPQWVGTTGGVLAAACLLWGIWWVLTTARRTRA